MSLFRKSSLYVQREKSKSLQPEAAPSISSLERNSTIGPGESKYRSLRKMKSFVVQSKEEKPTALIIQTTSKDELRKKASERFCLELVLFKEDFEKLILVPASEKDNIQRLTFNIWRNYFSKNSPNEINIPAKLSDKFRRAILNDDYDKTILEEIYNEVLKMLADNGITI